MSKSAPPQSNTDGYVHQEEGEMTDNWPIFEPPERDQVARHADDLIHRANLVGKDGWDEYRHRWSCGEVLGAALVLGDDAELNRSSETTISALERWALDLW